MEYLQYLTKDNDRWDNISYKHYGNPYQYNIILEANPGVRIVPRLPAGVLLRIPIIEATQILTHELLPPWKR